MSREREKVADGITEAAKGPYAVEDVSCLGMGPTICRSIVKNHGGALRARPNDGPG